MKSNPQLAASLFLIFCFTFLSQSFAQKGPDGRLSGLSRNALIKSAQHANPNSIDPTAAPWGHCEAITKADTNCVTNTIELSAFLYYVFTGVFEPVVVTWNNGVVAHKIIATAPGLWTWDPSFSGCEPYHWIQAYNLSGTFYLGNLQIDGPSSICPGTSAELIVETGGYNFSNVVWDPANPSGLISPYQISGPGNYALSVTDDLGCPFSAEINIMQGATITLAESIVLCPGDFVFINGMVINQPEVVTTTLPGLNGDCDTLVTYTVTASQYQTRAEGIAFCPGSPVTIGGQVYNQSAIVLDTLPSVNSCDTIVTYTLTLIPNQTRADTIVFCPGETIALGGTNYTQPGTVVLTLSSTTGGCDTIATYTLQFQTPAPSTLTLRCPALIHIIQANTSNGVVVNYSLPGATSDCPCPGIAVTLVNGLPSGSNFPLGLTSVCYVAKDSCGQSKTCCFNVNIVDDVEDPCDTKVNSCLKYELLSISINSSNQRVYRIRVTNNCSNKLLYTSFQVPNGIQAVEPANFSTYTAPSGNTYRVRNPSFTPQYGIRYSSISDSINTGESDIFKYTLPAQADVTFIHVVSRLTPNIYLSADINTFFCPLGATLDEGLLNEGRDQSAGAEKSDIADLGVFPNPASTLVWVETAEQTGELSVVDATGRIVLRQSVENSASNFSVEGLPQGVYQVVFVGAKMTWYSSLVVQH